tara:strand:- start:28 stop:777 length:750 start_codon:yes stop_codon:yes gene_type:complete
MKKILVTGSNSGLGKFLKKKLSAVGYTRNSKLGKIKKKKWDLIIHCAFKTVGQNSLKNLDQLINDNLTLSYNISRLKGKKIFISSCAVYEKQNLKLRNENVDIYLNPTNSIYSKFKLFSEQFFNKKSDLILRLGSIIGNEMRNNTVKKILYAKNPKIYLNQKSIYSFVSYDEIFNFINISQKKKLTGIYNVLRNDNLTLKEISEKLTSKKKIKFGKKFFSVVNATNKKFKNFLNNKSSLMIIKELKNEK